MYIISLTTSIRTIDGMLQSGKVISFPFSTLYHMEENDSCSRPLISWLETTIWCRYVKSRSDRQYRSPRFERETKTCDPESEIDDHTPIVPCGLVAWSLFNDTYRISTENNPIPINKKDIAWQSDKNSKFGSNVYPKNFQKQDPVGGGKLNESLPVSPLPLFSIKFYHIYNIIKTQKILTLDFFNVNELS